MQREKIAWLMAAVLSMGSLSAPVECVAAEELFQDEVSVADTDVQNESADDEDTVDEIPDSSDEIDMENEAEELTQSDSEEIFSDGETFSAGEDAAVIASGSCGDNATYTLYSDGYVFIEGSGEIRNLGEIRGNDAVKSVEISQGITDIDGYMFEGCKNLESVSLPEGLKYIEDSAFLACKKLTKIDLPESLEWIDRYAFESTGLTEVDIPGAVVIGNDAFASCKALTRVSLAEGITKIEEETFFGCSKLTEVNFPESITEIGKNSFYGCTSLKKLHLPKNITIIKLGAFQECTSLEEVSLPENLIEIEGLAFCKCDSLKTIQLPEGLQKLSGFEDCGLEKITIPDSVTEIAESAFYRSSNLTSVILPKGITSISRKLFLECSNLTDVSIPKSVKKIEPEAFSCCENLKNLVLPEGLTEIGEEAFYGTQLENVNFPDKLKTIGNKAFSSCKLKNVVLPGALTYLGAQAFEYNEELETISIPAGVTEIKEETFYYCRNLKKITLPENLQMIGKDAFIRCFELKGIYIPGKNTVIEEQALGYEWDYGSNSYKPRNRFVLIGQKGSTAETYAAENGFTFHNIADPLTHHPAASATCEKTGNIEHWHCDVCGTDFSDAEGMDIIWETELEKLSHEIVKVEEKYPTCTEPGNREYWHCVNCGKNFDNEGADAEINPVIPATGHSIYEPYPEISADCANEGRRAYYECSVCHEKFLDAEGKQPATDQDIIIPKNNDHGSMRHYLPEEATCINEGKIEYYHCDRCGRNYYDEEGTREVGPEGVIIPKNNNHGTMEYIKEQKATCTSQGKRAYYYCSNCERTFLDAEGTQEVDEEDLIIPGGQHVMTYHKQKNPTCSSVGKKAYYECSVCEKMFYDKEGKKTVSDIYDLDISETAHKWGSWSSRQVSSAELVGKTTDGIRFKEVIGYCQKYRKCSACAKTETGSAKEYGMRLNADKLTMKCGQSTTAFKVIDWYNGDYLKSVTSKNTKLVTVSNVNKNGTFKLTAKNITGSTTLKIKMNSGLETDVKVTVQKAQIKTSAIAGLKKSVSVVRGKTISLKPTLLPVTSQDKVTYSSSNKSIATVSSSGTVTGKKAGTAKITVKSGTKKTVVTVTVTKIKTKKLTGVPKTKTLFRGKTFTIKAVATPKNTDERITYKSSNTKIAAVTSKGVVKGLRKGKATITVQSGSKKMTCKVTVK